jgi:two-component system, chemotaxis family, protein-glutamate methylesterase/glutaminase
VEPVKVLLVDDSPFVQRAVQRMLEPVPEVRVVGVASDGVAGLEAVTRLHPDVVVLDIDMPRMDGLETIRQIMEAAPTPILVLSSHSGPGAEVTIKALELGAVDFLSKSEAGTRMDIYDLAPTLREKILAVAASRLPQEPAPATTATAPATTATGSAAEPAPSTTARNSRYELLVVGASTGGPRAITTLLSELPPDFPAGILIAQHMPHGFTATLAQRLDRRCAIAVREARDGDAIEPGLALLGAGGRHLSVERQAGALVARVTAPAQGRIHRPSVDLLFESAAHVSNGRTVGVVLTGMGHDGATGLEAIRRAGGRTLVESEESAVIYGMPGAAAESAERILPLDRLGSAVVGLFMTGAA